MSQRVFPTLPTVRKDLLFKFGGEIASRLTFIVFFFYLGRVFQPVQFGAFSLAISLATVLSVIFVDPGLNLAIVQIIVRRPETAARDVGVVLSAKVILFAPVICGLLIIGCYARPRFPAVATLIAAGCYASLNGVLDYFCAVTNAFHNMHLEAIIKIANRVLIVGLSLVALRYGGVLATLCAMGVATLASCYLGWLLLVRSCVPVFPKWNRTALKEILCLALPIAGTYVCATVYLKWDLVMLSLFKITPDQIGWYAAAFKILEAFSAIPGIFGAALFPMMVRLYHNDVGTFVRVVKLASKCLLLISTPLAVCINMFSVPLISRIYGEAYSPAGPVLGILVWSIIPMFVYFFFMSVNVAIGFARFNMWTGFASLIVSLVANVLLIPQFGYKGAAWAAVLANATFACLAVWKIGKTFPEIRPAEMSGRIGASGAIMFVAFVLVPVSAVLRTFIATVVFVLGIVAARGIGKEDLFMAWRFVGGNVKGASIR